MSIVEFFDPYNRRHLTAYRWLCQHGEWPHWFYNDLIDKEMVVAWSVALAQKMANAWVIDMLDFDTDEAEGDYLRSLEAGEAVVETGESGRTGMVGEVYWSPPRGVCVKWEDGMGTSATHGTRRIKDDYGDEDDG